MLINYRAFSWTYTAEELKQVLLSQMDEILAKTLSYTEKRISEDPDLKNLKTTNPLEAGEELEQHMKILESLKAVRVNLIAGEDSCQEWSDLIDWSVKVFANDPAIGGAYGTATYYARVKDGAIPSVVAKGKTKVSVDLESQHLELTIDIVL